MKLAPALLIALACSCTQSQVKTAESANTAAISLTNAVCALAPDSPVGQPYVEVVCMIAKGAEGVASVVIPQLPTTGAMASGASSVTMQAAVTQVRLQIQASSAPSFLASHKGQ